MASSSLTQWRSLSARWLELLQNAENLTYRPLEQISNQTSSQDQKPQVEHNIQIGINGQSELSCRTLTQHHEKSTMEGKVDPKIT